MGQTQRALQRRGIISFAISHRAEITHILQPERFGAIVFACVKSRRRIH
jgi:hypothetical protein